jgi:hypothetical protein
MKMRTGDPARHTDIPKMLAFIDSLADRYANAAHVAVHSDKSLAVINHHSIAVKEVITRGDNSSCSRRVYGSAFWGRYIHAAVRASGLVVQYSS